MARREIRCPVHGYIDRSQTEQNIIDCRVLQRLRRIRQLAMANLVYPGATHTRFGHSLGVMHVAGSMARSLPFEQEEEEVLRLAALLHDVGHGPFSHVAEEVFQELGSLGGSSRSIPSSVHETLTERIILSDEELLRYLGQDRAERIAKLLNGKGDTLSAQLLNGSMDADRQDYLLRDSYFCGVKYGVFDIERLHNTLRCHPDASSGDRFLAVTEDGVHAVEQFILARYYLTTQVYRHRVRLSTDAMIKRAIFLGITKDQIAYLRDLFTYDESPDYVNRYLESDDQSVISSILAQKGGSAKELVGRLLERKLFKRVFTRRVSEFGAVSTLRLAPVGASLKERIEQAVAEKLRVPPSSVAVASFNVESVREMRTDQQDKILVLSDGGRVRDLDDESELVSKLSRASSEYFLDIYADVEFEDDLDKIRKRRRYNEDIFPIVDGLAREEADSETQPS